MNTKEIKQMFSELISTRNWYSETSINRYQANELKRRFNSGELKLGRILEVLIECGYKIEISKNDN